MSQVFALLCQILPDLRPYHHHSPVCSLEPATETSLYWANEQYSFWRLTSCSQLSIAKKRRFIAGVRVDGPSEYSDPVARYGTRRARHGWMLCPQQGWAAIYQVDNFRDEITAVLQTAGYETHLTPGRNGGDVIAHKKVLATGFETEWGEWILNTLCFTLI